jgi:hypothetical protein
VVQIIYLRFWLLILFVVLTPLRHVFNLMLSTSVYPLMWKLSRIVPVFKSGEKNHIKNYRPVALLCNYAKLFECIFANVMYSHVSHKIVPEQHGFIKGRSTVTNLMDFTQFVSKALDKRLQVDVIYTDLTKAFDHVNHCIMLSKLRTFGLCDELIILGKALLIGRAQFVEYGGFKSNTYDTISGVTQGFNLGPLLFLLFYNDVVKDNNCKVFIYADDLKIAKIICNTGDCLDLQDSIDKLYSWCSLNKLQLNIDKCKKISFIRKTEVISFNFNVNGSLLARCNEISDLGVIMDTGLTFVPHMRSVVNKALKMLDFIFRNTSDFTNTISIKQGG